MRTINILLLEGSDKDLSNFIKHLEESSIKTKDLFVLKRIEDARNVSKRKVDIVISALNLPDSKGSSTYLELLSMFPSTPIIVLTEENNLYSGVNAIKSGVQNYIEKGELTSSLIEKTVTYAIEKQELVLQKEKALAELKKSNTKLQEFAYMATHDLRGPLVNFLSLIELFDKSDMTSLTNVAVIEKLEQNTDRMYNKLHELIDEYRSDELTYKGKKQIKAKQ